MFAVLTGLWANRKLIAVGILAVVLAGGWWYVGELRSDRAELLEALRVERLVSGHRERALSIATERVKEQEAENAELQDRIEEIENAPDSEDGPVAPVLRRTLDRLR